MDFKPAGLLTGIGSVPYTDPDEALSLVFSSMPEIPHWPQMPGRGVKEGFVFQFLTPLLKTGVIRIENNRAFFDSESEGWGEKLARFYSLYMAAAEGDGGALEEFSLPEDAAAGFHAFINHVNQQGPGEAVYFKGQLAGPLTVGFNLKDGRGRLAYYEDQLRDVLVKTLALHGRWQALKLAGLGRPAIIFLDEPGISVYGKSDYITVTREMIKKDLNEICAQVHLAGALAGVHSCDAIDWSILYQCDLEIVNLDAYNFGESLVPFAGELKDFILRGGILALGMVPTNDQAFAETVESLVKRLEYLWSQLSARGVPDRALPEQTMITPACGTGLLDPGLAAHIYRLTRELSGAVRELAAP
ncbi:MAG: hypothetical protein K6T65_09845 [Peptococcaceae bacterium]|nr:hypothetical protein [Peptococcaceae bacterium]